MSRRLVIAGVACALFAGAGTSAATTFRVDAKHDHSHVIPIPRQKKVEYEASYTGLGFYRYDYSDTSPSSGDGPDCPPIGAVTSEVHITERVAFDAVWHIKIPVDGRADGGSSRGKLKTNGSSYTFRGFYYDEACEKHTYPATGGAGAVCKGRLRSDAGGPVLYQFSPPKANDINVAFQPYAELVASPGDCPVSPTDFEPNPAPMRLTRFPSVDARGKVEREFLRRDQDGDAHYVFDTHLRRNCGSQATTNCRQSFKGDGNVILTYLGREG